MKWAAKLYHFKRRFLTTFWYLMCHSKESGEYNTTFFRVAPCSPKWPKWWQSETLPRDFVQNRTFSHNVSNLERRNSRKYLLPVVNNCCRSTAKRGRVGCVEQVMYSSWSSKKKASKNSANVLSPLFGHIGNCASENYLYFSGIFGFDKEVINNLALW